MVVPLYYYVLLLLSYKEAKAWKTISSRNNNYTPQTVVVERLRRGDIKSFDNQLLIFHDKVSTGEYFVSSEYENANIITKTLDKGPSLRELDYNISATYSFAGAALCICENTHLHLYVIIICCTKQNAIFSTMKRNCTVFNSTHTHAYKRRSWSLTKLLF